MAYSGDDIRVLVQATFAEYRLAAGDAVLGVIRNWWVPLFHILAYLCFVFIMTLSARFGMIAGIVIKWLLSCYLTAIFLSTVESGVDKERISLKELLNQANYLFPAVMNVFFILSIPLLVLWYALQADRSGPVHMALQLALLTVFNSLPESIYIARRMGFEAFSVSFEFIRENVIEWLFPLFFFWGLIVLAGDILSVVVPLFVVNLVASLPVLGEGILIQLIEEFFGPSSRGGVAGASLLALKFYLIGGMIYFFFVFRGALYRRLSTSGRRKRLYRYRAGG